ncbi:hypothetical protein FQN60_008745 [Etheostoma spectabile]|uniref:Glycosyltransferase family 92 protein n=1 Tax=Etheostoma spectabile TaxID=54343 RepID=A0A5J5CMJ4_9PERO|nr:hypothetical protein FQN60_008745 [Etheostoma spectabile]
MGVDRVVIYNTSCGPDLDRLLQSYSREGFVEMVPWPIDQHLNPSRGWLFSESGGDVHYFGQLTTLNECIYRSMDRSRYVLLNDIDEIIMPYQHNNLMMVQQTSIHEVLKMYGEKFKVPPDICRIIHSPISMPRPPEQVHLDTRLWDFTYELLPRVTTVLRRAGLLGSQGQDKDVM